MTTSGVEDDAWRLLGAFYDLSGTIPSNPSDRDTRLAPERERGEDGGT